MSYALDANVLLYAVDQESPEHARALSEQDGFWEVYRRTTRGLAVRGNLVPDAHLAALLVQHGVTTLYTRHSDFHKFREIQVRDPFA